MEKPKIKITPNFENDFEPNLHLQAVEKTTAIYNLPGYGQFAEVRSISDPTSTHRYFVMLHESGSFHKTDQGFVYFIQEDNDEVGPASPIGTHQKLYPDFWSDSN